GGGGFDLRGRGGRSFGRRRGEYDVAVEQRAIRRNAPRQRVRSRERQRLELNLVEPGIGGDDGERRVGRHGGGRRRTERGAAPGQKRECIEKAAPFIARARDDRSAGAAHVADA